MNDKFNAYFKDHQDLFKKLKDIESDILNASRLINKILLLKKKIMICGNGGSSADSQHFAAELIGRFEKERRALPAIALTTDTSVLTALGNDYGYNQVFARQVEGLADNGDILICISTSGNSKNIFYAIEAAKNKGTKTIGLLGRDGGEIKSIVDIAVIVPHKNTARIQEAHIFIIHFWCAMIESALLNLNNEKIQNDTFL